MATIKPFRAWRYALDEPKQIKEFTCPLFDVSLAEHLDQLYGKTYNSIHLSQPRGAHPDEEASFTLQKWKSEGVIQQDFLPGIYVYYQYFKLPGLSRTLCRKGFICMIDMQAHGHKLPTLTNDIQIHESTIPKAVENRKQLLESTLLNVSPTHGLYHDRDLSLEKYMDEAIRMPLFSHTDYQGVTDAFGVIHDRKILRRFIDHISDKVVVLADGHHRFKASVEFMMQTKSIDSGRRYHMIYLTNSASRDFCILPTHRIVYERSSSFNAFLEKAGKYFNIEKISESPSIQEPGDPRNYIIVTRSGTYRLRLQAFVQEEIESEKNFTDQLDVSIVHSIILGKLLNLPVEQQRDTRYVDFNSDANLCLKKVMDDDAMAILLNPIRPEDVYTVGRLGSIMPQKTTYFYPKVVCGYVFGSINEDEVNSPLDPCI